MVKGLIRKCAFFLGVIISTAVRAGSPLSAERGYLSELAKKGEISVSDFDYPFLITQTAVLSPLGMAEAIAKIEKHQVGDYENFKC